MEVEFHSIENEAKFSVLQFSLFCFVIYRNCEKEWVVHWWLLL